jgi:hypothetical protein
MNTNMIKNLFDIMCHTLPTMAVAIVSGFMTAFGLHSPIWDWGFWVIPAWLVAVLWIAPALMFLTVFIRLWQVRERRQHGGTIPSRQSWLEAYVPLLAVPVYVVSTFVFWKLNL